MGRRAETPVNHSETIAKPERSPSERCRVLPLSPAWQHHVSAVFAPGVPDSFPGQARREVRQPCAAGSWRGAAGCSDWKLALTTERVALTT